MTHRLVIIYHHTKFGKKFLSGSGDMERTQSYTGTELEMDRRMDKVIAIYLPVLGVGWGGVGVGALLEVDTERTKCSLRRAGSILSGIL